MMEVEGIGCEMSMVGGSLRDVPGSQKQKGKRIVLLEVVNKTNKEVLE